MATIQLCIELDKEAEYVKQRLGEMSKKAPMVIRNAINKTAKEAKRQDERITKQTYTAKRDINQLQFKKASTSNLEAILKDKGANIPISHFSHYASKRVGVSAIINAKHGRKRLGKYGNKAFYWNTIFVRKGRSRLPIEKMFSISSPVMHGNKGTWGTIEDEILQKLHENIEKELERILG